MARKAHADNLRRVRASACASHLARESVEGTRAFKTQCLRPLSPHNAGAERHWVRRPLRGEAGAAEVEKHGEGALSKARARKHPGQIWPRPGQRKPSPTEVYSPTLAWSRPLWRDVNRLCPHESRIDHVRGDVAEEMLPRLRHSSNVSEVTLLLNLRPRRELLGWF